MSISHPLAHSLAFMRKIGAQLWPLDLLLQDGVAPKAPLSNKLDMQQKGLPSCSPCLRKPRKEPIIPADPVPLYVRIKSDTRGEWVVRVGRPTTSGFGIPSCHAANPERTVLSGIVAFASFPSIRVCNSGWADRFAFLTETEVKAAGVISPAVSGSRDLFAPLPSPAIDFFDSM